MLQLGFATAILPEQSFDEVCDIAGSIGYRCIEVMCWPRGKADRRYAGVTHIDVAAAGGADGTQARSAIATALDRNDVTISSLGYYPNYLSADQAANQHAFDHLRRLIDLSAELGIGRVTTFIGRNPKLSVDENWAPMLEAWRPIVSHAADAGVRIGIENCPMLFSADEWPGGKNLATSPAIWRRLFKDLDSDAIGLNYDPSHMVWQQMDYLAPMREFSSRLVHVHAKDVRLDRHLLDQHGVLAHPQMYHVPKLPGLGDVCWGQFFSVLLDAGYRGPVCVEVEDRAYEATVQTRIDALRQSHRYLRQFADFAAS